MSDVQNRTVPLVLALLLTPLLSCGSDDPSPTEATGQSVVVEVATTGEAVDPDGYTVLLGVRSADVASTGSVTFEDVAAGSYEVRLEGVADNCSVEGGAARSVTVSTSSGAEAAFAVECDGDVLAGLPVVSCDGLSFESASGVPGDLIDAGSVPGTLEAPVVAVVRTPGGSNTGFALFEDDGEGGIDLTVPLHPSASMEGGEILLHVTDASAVCAPIPLTVDPLPGAEGELGSVVDALSEVLAAQLAILETTPESLAAMAPEDLPGPLVPMAVIQWVLDHPDNASSLRSIADGSASGDYPVHLIEALLGRVGVREAFQDTDVAPSPGPARAPVDPEDCTPEAVGQDTQALSDCIGAARAIQDAYDTLVREVVVERMAVALRATLALNGDQQATVRRVLGLVDWAVVNQQRETWTGLPSSLLDPVVELDPVRFSEDDDRTGALDARVSATSRGWAPSDYYLFDRLESVYVNLSALGADLDDVDDGLTSYIYDQVTDRLDEEPEITQQTFGPVPVNEENWSGVSWGASPVIEKVTHTTYRARSVGSAWLDVSVPGLGNSEAFPGTSGFSRVTGYVDEIIVRVEPSDTVINPEETETVPFRVTVENARYPDSITASIEQGALVSFSPSENSGSFTLQYAPPASGSPENPDSIHVEHFLRIGARENGPDRFGFAIVRFGEVIITPEVLCIAPLQEQAFSAEVVGADDPSVTWSAVHGTIDENGVYTAPSEIPEAEVDTIRATSVELTGLVGELVVPIGCTCRFQAQISGYHSADITASALDITDANRFGVADAVVDENGNLESIQFDGPFLGTGFEGSFLRDNWGAIPAGTTGSFEITGTAQVYERDAGGGGSELFSVIAGPAWWEPDWEALTLVIDSWEDGQVVGSLDGIVLDLEAPDFELPSVLRIDFVARTKVGGTTASSCLP